MRREDMKWPAEISDEVISLTKAIKEKFPHAKCYIVPELNEEDLFCSYDALGISYNDLRMIDLKPYKHLYIDDAHVWGPGIYLECRKDCTIDQLYGTHEEVVV